MASQGDRHESLRIRQPRHWNDQYVKGEVHQSWGPDEEYYPLMPRKGGGGRNLMGKVTAQGVEGSGDWNGLDYVDVTVIWGPDALIATTVRIYDHSGDIIDLPDLVGYSVWAAETKARTLDTSKDCDVLTPLFWAAVNRGCSANNQTFRTCV